MLTKLLLCIIYHKLTFKIEDSLHFMILAYIWDTSSFIYCAFKHKKFYMENIFFEKKISSKKISFFQSFSFFFFPCKKKRIFFEKKNNKLIIAERNERSSELVSELKSEKNSLSWTCLCARFNTAKMQMHCFSPDFSSCFLKIAKCSQSSIMNVSL